MNTYTAAVIGTGRIGFSLGFDKKREQPASHTMALLNNRQVELVAGFDSDPENLKKFKNYVKKYNKRVHTSSDYENYFRNISVPDIVVIAVNEDSHLKVTLDVISFKPKLIILEKPVALSVKEGLYIKEKAEEAGVNILVNHERRFARDYNFAKNYISKIGEILTVNARLDSGLRVYSAENEKDGGYSLWHDGTHLVDIVMFLLNQHTLNEPKLSSITFDKEKTEVVRTLTVHYSAPVCNDINLFISGNSRYFGFEVEIIGREGRIKIGNGIHEYSLRKESKLYTGFYSLMKDKSVKSFKKTGYFSLMVQNAVDFLDGKAELKSTLQTGIETLTVLEQMKDFCIVYN